MKGPVVVDPVEEEGGSASRNRFFWLYVALAIMTGTVVCDQFLAPRSGHCVVVDVGEHSEKVSGKRGRLVRENWSVVTLSNGKRIQAMVGSGWFKVGDSLFVEMGPVFGGVLRYKGGEAGQAWTEPAGAKQDVRIVPYIVCVISLLLLIPWPRIEVRWLLQALLIVCLLSWFLMFLGTGGLQFVF